MKKLVKRLLSDYRVLTAIAMTGFSCFFVPWHMAPIFTATAWLICGLWAVAFNFSFLPPSMRVPFLHCFKSPIMLIVEIIISAPLLGAAERSSQAENSKAEKD